MANAIPSGMDSCPLCTKYPDEMHFSSEAHILHLNELVHVLPVFGPNQQPRKGRIALCNLANPSTKCQHNRKASIVAKAVP